MAHKFCAKPFKLRATAARRYDGRLPQKRDYLVFFRTGYWFVNYAMHGESGALVYGFGIH